MSEVEPVLTPGNHRWYQAFDPCLYGTCGTYWSDHRCSQLWDPENASIDRQVLPQTGWEIEVTSKDKWDFPISREKTHVMHQIDFDIAAETYRVLEVRCELQNLPAHDTNDPHRQPWVGAENSSFVCTKRQGFRKPIHGHRRTDLTVPCTERVLPATLSSAADALQRPLSFPVSATCTVTPRKNAWWCVWRWERRRREEGVVWGGLVWCVVVRCGEVWCGVVWCGVVWCGVGWGWRGGGGWWCCGRGALHVSNHACTRHAMNFKMGQHQCAGPFDWTDQPEIPYACSLRRQVPDVPGCKPHPTPSRGKRLRGLSTSPPTPSEEGGRNLFHLLSVGCPGSGTS